MKRVYALFTATSFSVILLSGCGGGNKNEVSVTDAVELSERAADQIDENAKRQAARRERGDTLAMPYSTLQTYLPEVSGFTKDGGPEGSQMNMPGLGSWSQTEQHYASGDKTIDVTIFDYNGASNAFMGATALYSMGFSQEDDTKKSQTTDLGIPGVVAYESVYKQEQRAELIVVVIDRFLIQLNASGTNDIGILKDAAKNMKLDELTGK